MNGPKRARKHNSGGPEAYAVRECVLRVTPKQEFLKQAHKNEEDRPQHSPTQQLLAQQGQPAKGIPAKSCYQANQYGNLDKSDEGALPEQFPESPSEGQAVSAWRAALDSRHDQGGAKNDYERKHFEGERIAESKNTACGMKKILPDDSTAESEPGHEGRINQKAPAAAHSFVVQKNLMENSFGWRRLKRGIRRSVS